MQLEEEAIKTTRIRAREEQDTVAAPHIPSIQVLLHSRVQFGPSSLRELQVLLTIIMPLAAKALTHFCPAN